MARTNNQSKKAPSKQGRDNLKTIFIVVFVIGVFGIISVPEVEGKAFSLVMAVASGFLYWRKYKSTAKQEKDQPDQLLRQFQYQPTPHTTSAAYDTHNSINTPITPEVPNKDSVQRVKPLENTDTAPYTPPYSPPIQTISHTDHTPSQPEKQIKPQKPTISSEQVVLPPKSWGEPLAYQYIEKVCIDTNNPPRLDLIAIGDEITFQQEPHNPFDAKAVVIQTKTQKLGYVYKSNVQDMINDFKDRGQMVLGYVYDIYPADYTIKYLIGFYCFKRPKGKIVARGKLVANRSKDAQENVSYSKRYEPLSIEYDDEKAAYNVLAGGLFIGRLPKAMVSLADNAAFFVDSVEEDEDGKYHIIVAAYMMDEPVT
ncbi:MAG: hypothetical protein ACOX7B_03480 [Christensenellales bacterium]|jgi:hypothetical protein